MDPVIICLQLKKKRKEITIGTIYSPVGSFVELLKNSENPNRNEQKPVQHITCVVPITVHNLVHRTTVRIIFCPILLIITVTYVVL